MAGETIGAAEGLDKIRAEYPPYHPAFFPEDPVIPEDNIYEGSYPVHLWGGGALDLPIIPLPGGNEGIALFMSSELSGGILDMVTMRLALRLEGASLRIEKNFQGIAGIAKLGYLLAQKTASYNQIAEWIPLDSGRKYWYVDALSVPISSITTLDKEKRLYVDPLILDRVIGKTIVLCDDVMSTGNSIAAGGELLRKAGADDIILSPLFTEGYEWQTLLNAKEIPWKNNLVTMGHLPVFERLSEHRWRPIPETMDIRI